MSKLTAVYEISAAEAQTHAETLAETHGLTVEYVGVPRNAEAEGTEIVLSGTESSVVEAIVAEFGDGAETIDTFIS